MSDRTRKYEYVVDVIYDKADGAANQEAIERVLDSRSRDGWRLVAVSSNELGKNAMSVAGFGVNSTVDQTLLYFEREIIVEKLSEIGYQVPISKSNVTKPFSLNKLLIEMKTSRVSLSIRSLSGVIVQAIRGDLIAVDAFENEHTATGVEFFLFDRQNDGSYRSRSIEWCFPGCVPEGMVHAFFRIEKYVTNEGKYTPESTELMSSEEAHQRAIDNYLQIEDNRRELTFEDFKNALHDTRQALDAFSLYQKADDSKKAALEIEILSKL